jgi:hypothetical protein
MKSPTNPMLTAAILEAVNSQLTGNEPPEVCETHQRLIKAGYADEEAKKLMGAALSVEIYEMLKEKKAYNPGRYIKNLVQLPKMPWEDDE